MIQHSAAFVNRGISVRFVSPSRASVDPEQNHRGCSGSKVSFARSCSLANEFSRSDLTCVTNDRSQKREEVMTEQARTFLPAAGKDCLLPFYDPVVKLLGGDAARQTLVEQADLRADQRLLEVGCGTG